MPKKMGRPATGEQKLCSCRDTDLHDRIAERARRDNKSFSETMRQILRYGLEIPDNRIADNVVPFKSRTGTRVIDDPKSGGKSLNTLQLRDDPLGRMYDDGHLTRDQYEVGKYVARYFELARGNQVKAFDPSRVCAHPAHTTVERASYELIPREKQKEASDFLKDARRKLGWTRYDTLRRVLDDNQPTLQVAEFAAALNALAALCGFATQELAA
jgi:hypothetical protein